MFLQSKRPLIAKKNHMRLSKTPPLYKLKKTSSGGSSTSHRSLQDDDFVREKYHVVNNQQVSTEVARRRLMFFTHFCRIGMVILMVLIFFNMIYN